MQLLALGFVLRWVFGMDSPWLVVGIAALMVLTAARITHPGAALTPRAGIFASAWVSMVLTGFIVTFAVTGLIIQVDPWYRRST